MYVLMSMQKLRMSSKTTLFTHVNLRSWFSTVSGKGVRLFRGHGKRELREGSGQGPSAGRREISISQRTRLYRTSTLGLHTS